jgi:hypothetical protein
MSDVITAEQIAKEMKMSPKVLRGFEQHEPYERWSFPMSEKKRVIAAVRTELRARQSP